MKHYVEQGYMPSVRQIGRDLYVSHTAAHKHMKRLEEEGYIRYIGKLCIPIATYQMKGANNHGSVRTRIG